ncbi:hypothetical protein Ssi03_40240 [Sphaerisporangium siamense]|uniref:Putative repeat protein (TIGR01451 family) n=1 Tax=Sphaerisporangium siamense TaxID=795645 RepID=A0A7W7D7L7_9ACTN|nr:choice-of-anchor P family protein [Sphaerisporangium siamense]MBB4700820.1 putative repeat protein (TIGR01451 family) [Sphaerisporangium siamense]GII86034.1 hypothetical protein Ssi03_40240 [Sphaerisporangium siamense]
MRHSRVRGRAPGTRRGAPAGFAALVLSATTIVVLQAHSPAQAGALAAPKAPRVVFAESFENGQGGTPTLVTGYTGTAPVTQTYTADPAFLANCNGWIVSRQAPDAVPPATGCGGWWGSVKQLAGTLGKWAGGDPQTNHAVTAYTHADPGAGKTQIQAAKPVPIGAPDRFLTFSVDVAEVNCYANHAKLGFYLLDGGKAVPTFTTPIEPCVDASTVIDGIAVGTYTSDGPVLFGGSTVGLRLVNFQGSGYGNDHAYDNVRVLDVTPQLDVDYSPASAEVGKPVTLTFTITNTSELAVKKGWSFTERLPAGLAPTGATPATTCADATVTPSAGQVKVTGTLPKGTASCTAKVEVTAARAGTYETCADDLAAHAGVLLPACARVRFVPPVLVFDAHAYGVKASTPPVGIPPLAPSDLSCATKPGEDRNTLAGAPVPGLGSLAVLTTRASGVVDAAGLRTATASATTARLDLLRGVITADEIVATAKAADDDTGKVTAAGGVRLTNLRINGRQVVDPEVNLTVDIPQVAKVVVNEQVPGPGGRGVTVNAIHVRTLAGVEVIVSHARASLTVPGQTCPII